MILINLLPHRELARKRRKELFNIGLGASALVGGLLAGTMFLSLQAQISSQKDINQILQTDISKFDAQIKDIAGLEAEIAALRARQQAVEDLQSDRNLPVHLLTELVRQLPDGVFISSMRQEGQSLELKGVAQSNERVSELLRNLANNSPWFTKPDLVEIVAGSVSLAPRDVRRVSNFNIKVKLLRASDVEKAQAAAPGASASVPPVAAASAVSKG